MANKISHFLDSLQINKKILLIAVLVGLIHVSFVPIAKYSQTSGDFFLLSYNLNISAVQDLTSPYAAMINDVLDGHMFYNDNFTSENMYKLSANQQKVTIYVMSFIAFLVGGNITTAVIIMFFLFPALSFIAIHNFIQRSTGGKHTYIAVIFPLLIFLFTNNYEWKIIFQDLNIIGNLKEAFVQFFGIDRPVSKPLNFIRITTPLPNFLWFMLYLFLLADFLKSPGFKKSVFLGLFLGIAYYTYIYLVSLLMILTVITFFLHFYYNRNLSQANRLKKCYVTTGLISLIFAIPYVVMLYKFTLSDYGKDFASHMERASRFDVSLFPTFMLILTSGLIFYIFYSKRKSTIDSHKSENFTLVLFTTLIAGLIAINLQIIFGTNTQLWHWNDLFNFPVILISLAVAFSELLDYISRKEIVIAKRLIHTFGMFCIVTLLSAMIAKQASFARDHSEGFSTKQEYQQALRWIDENLDENSSIGTLNGELMGLLPAHTSVRVLLPYWAFGQITLQEFYERLGLGLALTGVIPQDLNKGIEQYLIESQGLWFPASVPDKALHLENFLEEFADGKYLLNDLMKRYKCTHILIDNSLKEASNFTSVPGYLELEFSNSEVYLYKVNYNQN